MCYHHLSDNYASSEDFQTGWQQIGSRTVSKYHLPKRMIRILIIPRLPQRRHFVLKWGLAGNEPLNHLVSVKKASRGSLARNWFLFNRLGQNQTLYELIIISYGVIWWDTRIHLLLSSIWHLGLSRVTIKLLLGHECLFDSLIYFSVDLTPGRPAVQSHSASLYPRDRDPIPVLDPHRPPFIFN